MVVREDREFHASTYPSVVHTTLCMFGILLHTCPLVGVTKDYMRNAGTVDNATILTNSHGDSLGCAVVVYPRPPEAARAIQEYQTVESQGRPMYVREDRGRDRGRGRSGGAGGRGTTTTVGASPADDGTQLSVGNLAVETTERAQRSHFCQCGHVRRTDIVLGPGGQWIGVGTVQFYNKEDAEAAIRRLHGSELQGCTLQVRAGQKPCEENRLP